MNAKIVFSSFEELKIQDVSFTDPIRPNVIVAGSGGNVPSIEVEYVRDTPIEVGLANIEVSFYSSEIIT